MKQYKNRVVSVHLHVPQRMCWCSSDFHVKVTVPREVSDSVIYDEINKAAHQTKSCVPYDYLNNVMNTAILSNPSWKWRRCDDSLYVTI